MLQFLDRFEHIIDKLEEGMARAVDETTRAIVDTAQENAPVDTSSYKESIYALTELTNGREGAVSEAQRVNPQVNIAPAISLDIEEGVHQGIVDVAAEHGVYIETGWGNVPGRPIIENAGDAHAEEFKQAVRAQLKNL